MESGLVAYWQFDECLGGRVKEKIGVSGHDAVLHGGQGMLYNQISHFLQLESSTKRYSLSVCFKRMNDVPEH